MSPSYTCQEHKERSNKSFVEVMEEYGRERARREQEYERNTTTSAVTQETASLSSSNEITYIITLVLLPSDISLFETPWTQILEGWSVSSILAAL